MDIFGFRTCVGAGICIFFSPGPDHVRTHIYAWCHLHGMICVLTLLYATAWEAGLKRFLRMFLSPSLLVHGGGGICRAALLGAGEAVVSVSVVAAGSQRRQIDDDAHGCSEVQVIVDSWFVWVE